MEKDFRTLKSVGLEVRPVRHWTVEHVRGHVFMCSLALRVTHEARKRLQPILERDERNRQCEAGSLREVWGELAKFSIGYMRVGEHMVHQTGELTEKQATILSLLGIPTDKLNNSRLSVASK